jgi:hypothetical protein
MPEGRPDPLAVSLLLSIQRLPDHGTTVTVRGKIGNANKVSTRPPVLYTLQAVFPGSS